MICLDWIDNHAEALRRALEGESICTPFLHVCLMEEAAPVLCECSPVVDALDKEGHDTGGPISCTDW